MSIKVMSQVWENGPARQSDRFVLLALADYANDVGECWPSVDSIRQKTCLSERGVQSVLRRLEAGGWLEIEAGGGRKNCNLYRVKTPHDMHPARYAPPHMDAETPHMDAKNPAHAAPEPSRTVKEPSESRETPVDVLCKIVRHETAVDFAAHRKAMKKPLTHEAARRLVSKLASHPDPDAVFDLSIENGWQGVFPEKVGGRNGNGNRNLNGGLAQGRENRPDPALEQIARLAGLGATSGNGGR